MTTRPAMPIMITRRRLELSAVVAGTLTLIFFLGPRGRGVGGIREIVARRTGLGLRPIAGLPWDALMAIVALLIGLVIGAAGVYAVAVRRALVDRDRAS